MPVSYESKTFTKPGRVAAGETPETYTCNQIVEGSLGTAVDEILANALSVVGDDVTAFANAVEDGLNRHLRALAGGTDDAMKVARMVVKAGLSGGKSAAEIAAKIRSGELKF